MTRTRLAGLVLAGLITAVLSAASADEPRAGTPPVIMMLASILIAGLGTLVPDKRAVGGERMSPSAKPVHLGLIVVTSH